MEMQRLNLLIYDRQFERLQNLKRDVGVSVNESIRRAIDWYLLTKGEKEEATSVQEQSAK